jgi:hypothetical protein
MLENIRIWTYDVHIYATHHTYYNTSHKRPSTHYCTCYHVHAIHATIFLYILSIRHLQTPPHLITITTVYKLEELLAPTKGTFRLVKLATP